MLQSSPCNKKRPVDKGHKSVLMDEINDTDTGCRVTKKARAGDDHDPQHTVLTTNPPTAITRSHLACRALEVVLQHCMDPNLGWHMAVFEESLPSLKESIVNARVALVPDAAERIVMNAKLMKELNDNSYQLKKSDVETWKREISHMNIQTLLPENPLPSLPVNDPEIIKYKVSDLQNTVLDFNKKYWNPVSLSFQYQTSSYLSELRAIYLELQMAVVTYFRHQCEVYRSNSSIIVHQVRSFSQWKHRMETIVERVLFSFALIPLMLEAERRFVKASTLCNTILDYEEDSTEIAISAVSYTSWLATLQDEFPVRMLRMRYELLAELEATFKSTIDSLKSIGYHIFQFNINVMKPNDSFQAQQHRSLMRKRAEKQLHQSIDHTLLKNMESLYVVRECIGDWFNISYPDPPASDAELASSEVTMLRETRWIESFCIDLDYIHRTTLHRSLFGERFSAQFSLSYEALQKCHRLKRSILSTMSPKQQLAAMSGAPGGNFEELELRPNIKDMLQGCRFAMYHCFQSLALRRGLIDAVVIRNLEGRGNNFFTREKKYLFRYEKVILADHLASYSTAYFIKRLQLENAESVNPESVTAESRISLEQRKSKYKIAEEAILLKEWQIQRVVHDEKMGRELDEISMFYSYPLLTHYHTDHVNNATVALNDALGLVYSHHLEYRAMPNGFLRTLEEMALQALTELRLQAIRCFQKAIEYDGTTAIVMHSAVTNSSRSDFELPTIIQVFGLAYDQIAKQLQEHFFNSIFGDPTKEKLTACELWKTNLDSWYEILIEEKLNPGIVIADVSIYKKIHKCMLLHQYIGLATDISLYEDNFQDGDADDDPLETCGFPDSNEIVELWRYIKRQMRCAKEIIMRPHEVGSISLTYVKEVLFWIEKALEMMMMNIEAYCWLAPRLLRHQVWNVDMYQEIFQKPAEWVFAYCQKLSMDPLSDIDKTVTSPDTMDAEAFITAIHDYMGYPPDDEYAIRGAVKALKDDNNHYQTDKLKAAKVLESIAWKVFNEFETKSDLQYKEQLNQTLLVCSKKQKSTLMFDATTAER